MSSKPLPTHAQTVIIGGGSIGCNTAYQLIERGLSDVVILEKSKLTSGTTWHAAGLITPGDSIDETHIEAYAFGRDLYKKLESITGLATGIMEVGYMQLAFNEERVQEMRRIAAFQTKMGSECYEISPKEALDKFPVGDFTGLHSAFFIPGAGRVNPVDVTMSVARGVTMGGGKIFEGVTVAEIIVKDGVATGVRTETGETITCENVVLCGGMWSRQIGEKIGLVLPLQAAEHYYLITEDMGISKDFTVIEDPSTFTYYREEGGGLMLGLFEPNDAAVWNLDRIPDDFEFGEIDPDWDRVTPHLEKSYSRVPSALEAGIKKLFCGPESFTPDLSPLIGETPQVKNCFVAAGINSDGISSGAGLGRILSHWIADGVPPVDVTAMNVNRFCKGDVTTEFRRDRVPELFGKIFDQSFPNATYKTARNAKQSILYGRLKAAGAYFIEDHGWEYADWYAPSPDLAKVEEYSWGRQNWWPYLEDAHHATRNDVMLMDMSDMTKFIVQGRDACKFLNRLSCNQIDVDVGRVVYTQWVNEKGGIENDLTITRVKQDKFMVTVAPATRGHTLMHMERNLGEDEFVTFTEVTDGITQINIHGPKARDLMEKLTNYDMSNENFPFGHTRQIEIGYAEVTAVRLTFVGELGWELLIPTNAALQTYDRIVKAGKEFGLRHGGISNLNCLRLEKAYREVGPDLDNSENPIEAGLGFVVKLDKEGGFLGRNALAAIKERGIPNRRLLQFLLEDPEPLLYEAETIYMNGKYAGYIGGGAYGFTLGGAVGMGYVEHDAPLSSDVIKGAKWEIEISGTRYPAKASLSPMYDPKMEKIRC